jgi:dCMP deaminase
MTWDEYFFNIVYQVALKSKDRSSKIGCVVVGPNNEIRSTGYNGFPRKINDDIDERHERPVKYIWTEHAERNAIYAAARVGVSLDGCAMYQSWHPCSECSRAIIQSGIKEIIIDNRNINPLKKNNISSRYEHDMVFSSEMLKEASISVRYWNGN